MWSGMEWGHCDVEWYGMETCSVMCGGMEWRHVQYCDVWWYGMETCSVL